MAQLRLRPSLERRVPWCHPCRPKLLSIFLLLKEDNEAMETLTLHHWVSQSLFVELPEDERQGIFWVVCLRFCVIGFPDFLLRRFHRGLDRLLPHIVRGRELWGLSNRDFQNWCSLLVQSIDNCDTKHIRISRCQAYRHLPAQWYIQRSHDMRVCATTTRVTSRQQQAHHSKPVKKREGAGYLQRWYLSLSFLGPSSINTSDTQPSKSFHHKAYRHTQRSRDTRISTTNNNARHITKQSCITRGKARKDKENFFFNVPTEVETINEKNIELLFDWACHP